jgi:hypothetical protein
MIKSLPELNGTVTQSTEPMLTRRPVSCSIEVKQMFSSDDPGLQLGVWTAAGFAKAEQIWEAIHAKTNCTGSMAFDYKILMAVSVGD